MLARLERHSFQSPRLQTLQRELLSHHMPGSRALARLHTIVDLIDSREHFMVRTLDAPFMYSVQVALAAERWRRAHGHAVRSWVTAIGEIEALLSFATYSYEHPADPFPEFVQGAALFDGTEIGHPLVPSATCVRNSVRVGGDTRVLLVSGSNMSGKSTLLRSVGINVVLAMAGAPVRARSFAAHSAAAGGQHPHQRFAAGGQLALLCRDHPPAQNFRPGGRGAGADVFAG